MPAAYVAGLLEDYSAEYIKDKIKLIGAGAGQIRNLPGLLLDSLRKDYVNIPGRPGRNRAGQGSSKAGRAGPKKKHAEQKPKPSEQGGERSERKRDLIKRLYLS